MWIAIAISLFGLYIIRTTILVRFGSIYWAIWSTISPLYISVWRGGGSHRARTVVQYKYLGLPLSLSPPSTSFRCFLPSYQPPSFNVSGHWAFCSLAPITSTDGHRMANECRAKGRTILITTLAASWHSQCVCVYSAGCRRSTRATQHYFIYDYVPAWLRPPEVSKEKIVIEDQ